MSIVKEHFDKWRYDYDFKTVASSAVSLVVTVVFALYNGFLGVYHSSLWHGTICVYYLILSLLRGIIVITEKRISRRGEKTLARKKTYLVSAVLLLILNLSLIMPVSLMVMRMKPVGMTLIPAIAMASYTTYKIVMASVNLKRRKKSENRLVRLLRTTGFIDALVSILTLQNTLIMVNAAGDGTEMLALSAVTSAAIMTAILALSVAALVTGIKNIRQNNKPALPALPADDPLQETVRPGADER